MTDDQHLDRNLSTQQSRMLRSALASQAIDGKAPDKRAMEDFAAFERGEVSAEELRNRFLTRYSRIARDDPNA